MRRRPTSPVWSGRRTPTRSRPPARPGANPVIPLVSLLRQRARAVNAEAATWLHRGLTSQDVVDTALMLCLREALDGIDARAERAGAALSRLADAHRSTVMAGRTLTQHAVPISFGLKASGWLVGVLARPMRLAGTRAALAVQVGGGAGTWPRRPSSLVRPGCPTRRPRRSGWPMVSPNAFGLGSATSGAHLPTTGHPRRRRTGAPRPTPWAGSRPMWRRWGGRRSARSANRRWPVAGARPRCRRSRTRCCRCWFAGRHITTPRPAATLHTAAALAVDERPDGPWHAEWATLRTLARQTVVAGSQTTELVSGLRVNVDRMTETVASERDRY